MADLVLVDNDERIVELVAWFLRRARHTVRTAESYAQVRALLVERVPDLMLADLELGEERGDEELPRLAREGLLPPTLVVSGYLDRELEAHLRSVPGVRGTLAKPFDFEGLERRIEECLARGGAGAPAPAATVDEGGWVEIEPDASGVDGEPRGTSDASAGWMRLDGGSA